MIPDQLTERSYQLIIDLVLSDGGDGFGILIVNDDTFEEHVERFSQMKDIKEWFTRRDRLTDVVFAAGQESITVISEGDFSYSVDEALCRGAYIVKIV